MDPVSIIAEASSIVSLAELAVNTLSDVAPFISLIKQVLGGTALTDAQRATMIQQEDAMRALLDATSIPADQP